MQSGFSLFEVLLALALSVSILSIVIIQASQSTSMSKKISDNQQTLESIFHTVDTIKSDLTKCGMRLQEAAEHFHLPLFQCSREYFLVTYGLGSEVTGDAAIGGEKTVTVACDEYLKKKRRILIYHLGESVFEYNEIAAVTKTGIQLTNPLQQDYPAQSVIVPIKRIEYKLYRSQHALKRKVDRGYFQPLIDNVSDFYINFFPESNSVLYRLEVNGKEQIRGYIFLINMV